MSEPRGPDSAAPVDLAHERDFEIGRLTVRPALREIECDVWSEFLEPRVMQVFVALWRADGAVVSRDDLVESCWGGRIVGEDALVRCIGGLRRLAQKSGSFSIVTVPRVGYRLTPVPIAAGSAGRSRWRPTPRLRGWQIGGAAACAGLVVVLPWLFHPRAGAAPPRLAGRAVSAVSEDSNRPPGSSFRDCDFLCPDMVVLPPGRFTMGAPGGDPEGSENPREIEIAYKLAVAKYDVTREQYARFVLETGRQNIAHCFVLSTLGRYQEGDASWLRPGFEQSERDPAVCVSWDDATAYAEWLSHRTGKRYRLLSEAEWEYAARAGRAAGASATPTAPPCASMNTADRDYARAYPGDPLVNRSCGDGFAHTSPVGSFPPSAFGLYDMLGNVWQWTADCYDRRAESAPHDGSPWNPPNCSSRVARGGSWEDDPARIRVSRREGASAPDEYPTNGLRVARTVS